MKKLLLPFLLAPFIGMGQIDTTLFGSTSFANNQPKHLLFVRDNRGADTLSCHFLEVINDSTFKWKSGYVIARSGYFDFGKTSVSKEYLPITSGIVTSPLFYSDMIPIKKYAIQIVVKQAAKRETTIVGQ